MTARIYLLISGTIFGLAAIFHVLRVVIGWTLTLHTWSVPMWVSWLGTILPAVLCIWALGLAFRKNLIAV